MRKIIWIIVIILLTKKSFAQGIDNLTENSIRKNIIAYHLRYAFGSELNIDDNNILKRDHDLLFERMLTNNGILRIELNGIDTGYFYPNKNFKLYSVFKRGYRFDFDSLSYSFDLYSFEYDDNYLIAYSKSDSSIKYISGNFFISQIIPDFNIDINNPASFYNYMKLRTYKILTYNISFIKRDAHQLIFKAYSKLLKKTVLLSIDLNNLEIIKIIK